MLYKKYLTNRSLACSKKPVHIESPSIRHGCTVLLRSIAKLSIDSVDRALPSADLSKIDLKNCQHTLPSLMGLPRNMTKVPDC